MDARLRAAERAAATGDADAVRVARRRLGLCEDCGGSHPVPVTSGCKGDNEPLEWEADGWVTARVVLRRHPHAPGTRAGEGCSHCRLTIVQASTPRPRGEGRWAAHARAAIRFAVAADPCPARRERVIRAAKPWGAYSSGNGLSWPNQVWRRERDIALGKASPGKKKPIAEDPRQGVMW